jgi:hypothetical protein
MKSFCSGALGALGVLGSLALVAGASAQIPILQAGDPVLTIDRDPIAFVGSSYPAGENPPKAIDNINTNKYLNFGGGVNGRNIGVIVTPAGGPSVVQNVSFVSANDDDRRDPMTFDLYGTNDPVLSADNSDGNGGEVWTLIGSGATGLPLTRNTAGPVVPVVNATAYTSYRVVFPEIRNFRDTAIMQVAEINLLDGSLAEVTAPTDVIKAIHLPVLQARSPSAEGPDKLFDNLTTTKFLNFGEENSGFIVTPASGPSVIDSFQITTANDAEVRDPSSWILYGTNDPITSPDFSQGGAENWVLIDQGPLSLPATRQTAGGVVDVNNVGNASYSSYRMVFPTVKNAASANSMQISGIQFFAVPEPASVALALVGLVAIGGICRSSRRSS